MTSKTSSQQDVACFLAKSMTTHISTAIYEKGQPNARHAGNQLIEALRPAPSLADIRAELEFLPPFDPKARKWDTHLRMGELLSLTNIMVPLSSHFALASCMDSMIREGYVGRAPMSAAHIGIYQQIAQDKQERRPFRQSYETVSPVMSTSLIGVSGMGKTTTVRRFLERYEKVIYHPQLDIYQIPWLHFEMPDNGKGVKALLSNIVQAIAELIPDNNYLEDHLRNGRATVESLQSSVRILLNKHCVGLLVPDEVQHVANTNRGDQEVMSQLTTLANKSRTPVLYIGTPKAEKVLGLDLRQARRSIPLNVGSWTPLHRQDSVIDEFGEVTLKDGEWVHFMTSLWQYCWLRKPTTLTSRMLDVFYDCTQGIIDLAIKLFVLAQARAMTDGTEALSEQIVLATYRDSFKLVHPMIEAMRRKDPAALSMFEDVKLPQTSRMLDDLALRQQVRTAQAATPERKESEVAVRVQEVLVLSGVPSDTAASLATQVAQEGAGNILEASKLALARATPTRPVSSRKAPGDKRAPKAPTYNGLEERQSDFRNSIVASFRNGTSISHEMQILGFLPQAQEVICLD